MTHNLYIAALAATGAVFFASLLFMGFQRGVRMADARADDRRKREALQAARMRQAVTRDYGRML